MKILIATGIFPPEIGGPATYATELATNLVRAGHMVTVVTYSERGAEIVDESYPFYVHRIYRTGKLSNYIRCFWYLFWNIKKHDVVYTLDWFSIGVPLFCASALRGKKYAVRVGGAYIWEKYLSKGKPPLTLREFYEKSIYNRYPFMYVLIKLVFRGATPVIFNSNVQAALYNEHYDIPERNIRVIYNPLQDPEINVTRSQSTKEIVFVGRFIAMKNIESLLRAFAKMGDTSYTLLLIGEGPRETALRELVSELGISERVSWSGPLPRKELFTRIIDCAYVVIPSWTDISPNQAYECLSLGIPFLITKENYLAIGNEHLLTIDPKSVDDILEKLNLLTTASMYEQFSSGLKNIEFSYSWAEATKDHLTLFSEFLTDTKK
jgi:glycosyltransferase involved in cell wall biosynthesis